MTAIVVHHTATSTEAWDGPANEARIPNTATASTLRRYYAWVDPDMDPDTKAAYKFGHHVVSSDGTIGAANMTACSTGIAVLNGARGGTTIPTADKQGVWNHLARHLRDGDQEPPPLDLMITKREAEQALRDAGLSVSAAKALVAEGWNAIRMPRDERIHSLTAEIYEWIRGGQ